MHNRSTILIEMSKEELVDLSFIMELAGNKPDYIKQVLFIFMGNTPPGLITLQNLIQKPRKNWDAISKQAHFLKSSVGIVKIKGMHEKLQQIETLARERGDKEEVYRLLDEITATFREAEVIIKEKLGDYKMEEG